MFPKNIEGDVVTEIPDEVFQRLVKDLEEKGLLLQEKYIREGSVYVLNDELKQKICANDKQLARNSNTGTFSYRSHLAGKGWVGYSLLGQVTGTTGE